MHEKRIPVNNTQIHKLTVCLQFGQAIGPSQRPVRQYVIMQLPRIRAKYFITTSASISQLLNNIICKFQGVLVMSGLIINLKNKIGV